LSDTGGYFFLFLLLFTGFSAEWVVWKRWRGLVEGIGFEGCCGGD
jgi:hypothetical protein